ncbi:MAG: hypothetical protein JWM89_631 [Acidimicrobiales bacterium]|nr:hypothetical protein [Acidimicrobiales bacterium]
MGAWSRRRKALTAGGVLVGIWLVVVGYLLVDASLALGDGAGSLRSVRRRATVSALVDPSTRDDVVAARGRFSHASSRLDNPLLGPLRLVPVVSRHLAAARRLAHASRDGASVADRSLSELGDLVEQPHSTGAQRIALLRDLGALARRASSRLERIDVGTDRSLVSSLGDAVGELSSQRDEASQGARRLDVVSRTLADILDGPEPYLLLGANNAEMRNDGGMFLSAATLGLDHGSLHLGTVRPTADTVLPAGSIAVPAELARNWSFLDAGRDLRNLGLTADFPQSARLAVANWAQVPGGARTAGVIVVDVDAIRSLLRVVGPVTAGGTRYTADNVREQLLREQYRRFAGDRAERRDQLGQVARVIFDRLQHGQWDVAELATQLSDAVQGRHLMVWSSDPKAERAWRSVGADGHLTDRSLSVALLNRGAEKLDSWIRTRADVRGAPDRSGRTRLTVTYRVTNGAPATGPAYLVGPNVTGLSAGDHRGFVVVHLPAGSSEITMTGARQFLAGHDGPTEVVGGDLVVRRGATATVTVTALLPSGRHDLVIEPSARIQHTEWVVEGHAYDLDRRRTVAVGS